MPRNPNWQNRPHPVTPEMPVLPQRPNRPNPTTPEIPVRPQPPFPQRPNWPEGMTPQMPVRPNLPRQSFMPRGFSLFSQGRIGLVVSPRGGLTMFRRPTRRSQVIGNIPHFTFIWVFGERNGWSLVHYYGQFGFVDSRFIRL